MIIKIDKIFIIIILEIIMLECLACRTKIVEAFQHFEHHYLICRHCFSYSFKYCYNNSFYRVSLLKSQIHSQAYNVQRHLLNFLDNHKISVQNIFNNEIIALYRAYLQQKSQSQQLSTEYSLQGSDNFVIEKEKILHVYDKYDWIKQKLNKNYATIKQSTFGMKVSQNISPVKQKIIEKTNKFSDGISFVKSELKSMKKQAPSISDLKQFDISGFLLSKYNKLF